jgi:predicted nucleic acid-binding protein
VFVIDTSVWSRALRRRRRSDSESTEAALIRRLVHEDEPIGLPGIVLQELLSGVRTKKEFERLRKVLDPFAVLLATEEHHLLAASLFNTCKSKGLNVSPTDVLIAATSIHCGGTLITADNDFVRMAEHIDLTIHFVE